MFFQKCKENLWIFRQFPEKILLVKLNLIIFLPFFRSHLLVWRSIRGGSFCQLERHQQPAKATMGFDLLVRSRLASFRFESMGRQEGKRQDRSGWTSQARSGEFFGWNSFLSLGSWFKVVLISFATSSCSLHKRDKICRWFCAIENGFWQFLVFCLWLLTKQLRWSHKRFLQFTKQKHRKK